MSKLVDELKKEHLKIAEILGEVNSLGITTPEAQKLLLSAKQGLLSHLSKEDKFLYPVLRREAESNEGLKRTLEIFAKDMEGISKVALEFFEKYAQGGSGFEFGKDFGRLFSNLSTRIMKEEKILYQKFDDITNGNNK